MRQDKDRSGKWLIGHHGDGILKLAGFNNPISWRAVHSELVAPRRLPDGLIEAVFPGNPKPTLFLIEIETYPGSDVDRQVFDDLLLVALDRGIIPEVVTLVLRPKGNLRVEGRFERTSQQSTAQLAASWRVLELWNLKAEELLATNDVGLIPWVPLTRTDRPPAELLKECRERIESGAKPEEIPSFFVVTQLLASLVFPRHELLDIFGKAKPMIDMNPWLSVYGEEVKQIIADRIATQTRLDTLRSAIIANLEARFGEVPKDRLTLLDAITDETRLRQLLRVSATCPDADTLIAMLPSVPAA